MNQELAAAILGIQIDRRLHRIAVGNCDGPAVSAVCCALRPYPPTGPPKRPAAGRERPRCQRAAAPVDREPSVLDARILELHVYLWNSMRS